MITAALLAELGSNRKRMKVEGEKKDRQEKDRPDQAAGCKGFFHNAKTSVNSIIRVTIPCQDKPTPGLNEELDRREHQHQP